MREPGDAAGRLDVTDKVDLLGMIYAIFWPFDLDRDEHGYDAPNHFFSDSNREISKLISPTNTPHAIPDPIITALIAANIITPNMTSGRL